MKLALWLTALGCLALAGCSVNHRSGDFTCDNHTACADNRVCVDGLCVLVDTLPVDAPRLLDAKPLGDAQVCPPGCTSCDPGTRTCAIDCSLNGGCAQAVVCPAGWNCDVLCSTPNSCRNGITCPSTMSCAISCTGFRSCQGITCGSGRCNVSCSGSQSCRDVSCGASCACDVSCLTGATCTTISCTLPSCTSPLRGCTSLTAGCNTCP